MKAHLWEHMKRDWQGEGRTERGREVSVVWEPAEIISGNGGKRKGTERGLECEASAHFAVWVNGTGLKNGMGGANNNF